MESNLTCHLAVNNSQLIDIHLLPGQLTKVLTVEVQGLFAVLIVFKQCCHVS